MIREASAEISNREPRKMYGKNISRVKWSENR